MGDTDNPSSFPQSEVMFSAGIGGKRALTADWWIGSGLVTADVQMMSQDAVIICVVILHFNSPLLL